MDPHSNLTCRQVAWHVFLAFIALPLALGLIALGLIPERWVFQPEPKDDLPL